MTADWKTFCNERSNHLKELIEAEERRIMQLEKNNTKLSELSVQMGEILKYHQEQLNDREIRLSKLENEPKKITDIMKNAAVSACVSGMISYLITRLI